MKRFLHPQALPEILITGIFLLIIIIPLIITAVTPVRTQSTTENRVLASRPVFDFDRKSLQTYPQRFETYFNDQFGLKEKLIALHNLVKIFIFHASPVPKVELGKEGWLFFKTDWFGRFQPSPQQLEALRMNIQTKQQWLARKGIRYLYVPAPIKRTIYPEKLGNHEKYREQPSQLDVFLDYLQSSGSNVTILDLRKVLWQEKTKQRLYYQIDHHWNDSGAFVAYQHILKQLNNWFLDLQPLSKKQLEISENIPVKNNSLSNMLGLSDFFPETTTQIRVKEPCAVKRPFFPLMKSWSLKGKTDSEEEWYRQRIPLQTLCSRSKLKVIVFRDSFFSMMMPYFSEHFQNAVYIWTKFDYAVLPKLIKDIQPDIVIEECVESEIFLSQIDQEIHKTKGLDFLVRGEKKKAAAEFYKALKQAPDNADNLNNLAYALLQMHRLDEAAMLCQKALRIDPDHANAHRNKLLIDNRIADLDAEIAEKKKQIALNPDTIRYQAALAGLLRQRGYFKGAISQYQAILHIQPHNTKILKQLAALYASLKQYPLALQTFLKVNKINPQKPDTHYNLACIYAIQNNTTSAIQYLQKAVEYGYHNMDRLKYDPDLENIRQMKSFQDLITKLEAAKP